MMTKIIAITGTLISMLPIVAPIFLSIVLLISKRILLFDYLMPAELFPAALMGWVLLYWAAYRVNFSKKIIGLSICTAVLSLVAGQAFALITGAASGSIKPWQLLFISGTIILYSASLLLICFSGFRLLRKIFRG